MMYWEGLESKLLSKKDQWRRRYLPYQRQGSTKAISNELRLSFLLQKDYTIMKVTTPSKILGASPPKSALDYIRGR